MEKTYKILKIVLLVLCIVAVLVAIWRFSGSTAETAVPETQATEAAVETTEAANPAAPDVTVYDAEGNAHKLSDYRGTPVILNFWASWCGPCKSEMPDFEEKYQEYGGQIQFLIVNLTDGSQETVETASDYVASQGYTFPVFFDTDMDAAVTYGISAIPVTYFIDEEGYVVGSQRGMLTADALQQGIDLLLGE